MPVPDNVRRSTAQKSRDLIYGTLLRDFVMERKEVAPSTRDRGKSSRQFLVEPDQRLFAIFQGAFQLQILSPRQNFTEFGACLDLTVN